MRKHLYVLMCFFFIASGLGKPLQSYDFLRQLGRPAWITQDSNRPLDEPKLISSIPKISKKYVNGIPVETENGPAIISMDKLLPYLRKVQPNIDINTVDKTSTEWNNLMLKYLLAMKKNGYDIREMSNGPNFEDASSRVRFLRVY
ncbi:uncharacterized protein LOC131880176 [Tigriopus californicus]|uniref:uncharacterized protein LOC131880176 n=1 Tax=Tigriopus californicus TaxID=6832 RepID=UPI0027DA036A|nr:uncharacterized protein LOC131880176 [Tigriopus californicus]